MTHPFRSRQIRHANAVAAPGPVKRNVAGAAMYVAHALACIKAGKQNLIRAERESPGITGKTRTMLGIVIEQLERGNHPQPEEADAVELPRDEEE
jgi:hypothetical protein